jgi:hypothetical protein
MNSSKRWALCWAGSLLVSSPASAAPDAAPLEWADELRGVLGTWERFAREARAAGRAVAGKEMSEALRPGLSRLAWDRTRSLVQSTAVGALSASDWTSLQDAVVRDLERRLDEAGQVRDGASALLDVVRAASAGVYAEPVVAAFFGHESPKADGPEAASEVTGQVRWQSTDPTLGLKPGHIVLAEEVAPTPTRDGRVQTGEWVRLEVSVVNNGTRPWFSTSSFIESGNACVVVVPDEEQVLQEMAAGDESPVSFWALVAPDCREEGPRRVKLRLRDTHRPVEARIDLDFESTLLPTPTLGSPRLDADVPGSSDGSDATELRPDLVAELTVDVTSTGQAAAEVSTSFSFPPDAAALFVRPPSYRGAPLERLSETSFRASDDVDFAVVPSNAFDRVRQALKTSAFWTNRTAGAQLWLAVDTTVRLPARGRAKGKEAAPTPPDVVLPDAAKVAELVRSHLSLEARPAKPQRPGGLLSTDGYDVVFDETAFKAAFKSLTAPPRPTRAAETSPIVPPVHRFRHYVAVPMAALVPEPVVVAPPPPPPAPAPMVVAPSVEAPAGTPVRVSLGLALGNDGRGWTYTGPVARLAVGDHWRYLAQAADQTWQSEGPTRSIALSPVGIGRAFAVGRGEVMPFVGAGLRLQDGRENGVFGEGGLIGHPFGTTFDLEWSLTARQWDDGKRAVLGGVGLCWKL